MNGGAGALNQLNQKNIPSGANSHQHHVIAIVRNFRRFYRQRIARVRTSNNNQINELNEQLSEERLNIIQTTLDFMIQQIEYSETIETMSRQYQLQHSETIQAVNRQYQVEQVIDRIIQHVENNEKQPTIYFKQNLNEEIMSTSLISDVPQNNEDENRLRAVVFDLGNELPPNYLLLHDFIPPNLISLARSLRSIEKFDNLMVKGHSKIFNHEERVCCNCDGTNGKFPSPPRHKRILLYIFIKLILNERSTTRINDERHELYFKCEKQFSTEKALTKYRGINLAQFIKNNRSNDEKQFFCSLFRLTIPKTYYIS
ncbi:unnamed protein product [Rotaria magnacalcarata]|uniref:Uncharacterized protein n=2 Tax=Rotaria magnacalcarata TaxID=392030 RepID=A0A819KS48_9BILA|nr:unnamed protein product [Rotaria magnacalcarata]